MRTRLALLPLLVASALSLPQAVYGEVRADSLLSVDQNRAEIVEGLVAKWKDHLATGKESDLKKTLMGLRADKLLAVSLAQDQKQFAALLEKDSFLPVKNESPVEAGDQGGVAHAKALGDTTKDVVYTPITPCRVFDTRPANPLVAGVARSVATRGALSGQGGAAAGCGIPDSAAAVMMQLTNEFPSAAGFLIGGAEGTAGGGIMVYAAGSQITVSTAMPLNTTNGRFALLANNANTQLIGDVVGYFAPPANGNGLRVVQTIGISTDAPNVINGSANNSAGSQGATVAGGGAAGNTCLDPPTRLGNRPCGNRTLANFATVGGGAANLASGTISTVGGGESNTASNTYSTVAGGFTNIASGTYSTVAGGESNTASNGYSTVAGGVSNTASGISSTVGGGASNTAGGFSSTVAGGNSNTASGDYSFAAGVRANAFHERSFVWGGAASVDTNSAGPGTFVVYAPGSINMYAGPLGGGGCILTTPANGWACASDRDAKTNIRSLNVRDVLKRVVSMPVASWSFKGAEAYSHIGPMAQDFAKAFGLGGDEKTISVMDTAGVALAAIQGLNQVVKEKDAKIRAQGKEISTQASELATLKRELAAIKQKLGL